MNSNDTITLAFIFKDKGSTLQEVKVIRPGSRGKTRATLLINLNNLNIESDGEFKFRMVDVRMKDYINRKQLNQYLEAIRRYYFDRYKKKRYDSKKSWFQSYHVECLLKDEKESFISTIENYKREMIINNLIGNE